MSREEHLAPLIVTGDRFDLVGESAMFPGGRKISDDLVLRQPVGSRAEALVFPLLNVHQIARADGIVEHIAVKVVASRLGR